MELTEEEEKNLMNAGQMNHERRIRDLEKRIEKLETAIRGIHADHAIY